MSDTKVKVAVRVRPLNRRGEELSARFRVWSGRGRGQLWKLRGRGAGAAEAEPGPVRPAGGGARTGRGDPARRLPAPGSRLGRLPGEPRTAHESGLRARMLDFATSVLPLAFRTGTEHQVRGGDGRESNGPAPSSF